MSSPGFLQRFIYGTRFLKMTIKQRIIIAVMLQAFMVLVIGFFVYFSFDNVLSKLHSIEIIDDVNIGLLEMRKAEKNYFLYHDLNALKELAKLGEENRESLQSSKSYVTPILQKQGRRDYDRLLLSLKEYLALAHNVIGLRVPPPDFEGKFRSLGQELTSLSGQLLQQERENVSRTINNNVLMLIASLVVIFLIQLILWQYFFRLIIEELNIMARLIKKVSEGRFHEVAVQNISPHNEIEIAIKAISDMARKLEKREDEILQSGKLASLGVLISGVAHELGNPLNNISMMAQTYLSLYDMLGDEEKKTYLGDIYTQTERIRKIVENLLDFSRQKKQELQESNLKEIVQLSLALVGNNLKLAEVKPHVDLPDDLPQIYVDVSQIEQVLVNLFINAIQAMPEGGDLFVRGGYDQKTDYLVLEVRDTGLGIPKDLLPNIFDPFFSTKSTKGTGLGLSVSYGIIRQHHGDITVESEEGLGTRFTIKLPSIKSMGVKDAKKDSRGG
jgi:two-component system, NtrC family, sensor kinase